MISLILLNLMLNYYFAYNLFWFLLFFEFI